MLPIHRSLIEFARGRRRVCVQQRARVMAGLFIPSPLSGFTG